MKVSSEKMRSVLGKEVETSEWLNHFSRPRGPLTVQYSPTTQNLGRGINRVVDLFQDVEDIVRLADEHASRVDEGTVSSDEESADEDEEETEEERAARMERLQERRV